MPAPKQTPAEAQPPQEPSFPVIEALVERASPDEVSHLFEAMKQELAALKGPKAEQAKKVRQAIAQTEALLSHLLQVREKLEADKKSGGRGPR